MVSSGVTHHPLTCLFYFVILCLKRGHEECLPKALLVAKMKFANSLAEINKFDPPPVEFSGREQIVADLTLRRLS